MYAIGRELQIISFTRWSPKRALSRARIVSGMHVGNAVHIRRFATLISAQSALGVCAGVASRGRSAISRKALPGVMHKRLLMLFSINFNCPQS
jgi:hypothetical protein